MRNYMNILCTILFYVCSSHAQTPINDISGTNTIYSASEVDYRLASKVPTNRTITVGSQVGSLESNLVFASTGTGVTESTVTNIAQAVVTSNVPTLAQVASSGGFAGTETISPMNITMGGYWKSLYGGGYNVIEANAYGASQSGFNDNSLYIGESSFGASQMGQNSGYQEIGNYAFGARQAGQNDGYLYIGNFAYGTSQMGYCGFQCSASNNAIGAIQLFWLTNGQHAVTTIGGGASLTLGAGTTSNKNSIVAGDGECSHGDGSITAGGGFFGSGVGITGITPNQIGALPTSHNTDITAHQDIRELISGATSPYKVWTGTITPANGTATVTYAHGNMPRLMITSPTVITLDPTGYGTNGVSRISLSLFSGTNSVTLATNVITYATTPTIGTNCWNTILIRRVSNCAWKGVGL